MMLSVVIPVFNGAAFIEQSYQQIERQGIIDLELIYVNNNSTDASEEIIKVLMERDLRVKYLKQPKQGAAAARNMGISEAKGKYIYMFDVDDEIFPGILKRMIKILDEYPDIDAVFGKMVKSNKSIGDIEKPEDETHEVILKSTPYWGLLWFEDLSTVVGPPAFLYRKTVLLELGGYNEDLRIGQDTALDIELGMTKQLAFLDTYVYLYFKHENSTIQQSKSKMPRAFMIWTRLVKAHIPFYLSYKVPLKFKQLLYSQLCQSMARQLCFTQGLLQRHFLKNKLLLEIAPLRVPFIIGLYLSILVLLPWTILRKFYGYYLVPFVINRLKI
ncbi:glycosyltransferase [Aestuariibaculum sp. M13]|uniref:glycosyltransferase family 2 protein n=1 Tax=Aestuariibaculum sp. M13 TaxID=2967132 RepID=UPI002159E5BB|nr:glycosyltransferase family 2 protein [Aestuariibaculum sp. M13]MCR8666359.1 glycosyltransferase [Aestuariibaculum sp. M13]